MPLSEADVLAIIVKAHRETTEESLKDMDGATSASSGNDLLARDEQLGFDRQELRKAIVERVRENKKLAPLQSDLERERERLGLPKDATAIDVAREQTVRKPVEALIASFTEHLQDLTRNGIKEGVNVSRFSRKDYNLEVPEYVDGIPGDSYVMPIIAARCGVALSATTFLCGLASLDGVPSNSAFLSGWPAIVGGGMALIGSLWASFCLRQKARYRIHRPHQTNKQPRHKRPLCILQKQRDKNKHGEDRRWQTTVRVRHVGGKLVSVMTFPDFSPNELPHPLRRRTCL
jgi:hypothetical protein